MQALLLVLATTGLFQLARLCALPHVLARGAEKVKKGKAASHAREGTPPRRSCACHELMCCARPKTSSAQPFVAALPRR